MLTAQVPRPPGQDPNVPCGRYYELTTGRPARSALGVALANARVHYALALLAWCPIRSPMALHQLATIRDPALPCASLARALVQAGHALDGSDSAPENGSPMIQALEMVNPTAVAALLAAGAPVDTDPCGFHPLDRFARQGHNTPPPPPAVEIVRLFVEAGAQLDVPTFTRQSLHDLLAEIFGQPYLEMRAAHAARHLEARLPQVAPPPPDPALARPRL